MKRIFVLSFFVLVLMSLCKAQTIKGDGIISIGFENTDSIPNNLVVYFDDEQGKHVDSIRCINNIWSFFDYSPDNENINEETNYYDRHSIFFNAEDFGPFMCFQAKEETINEKYVVFCNKKYLYLKADDKYIKFQPFKEFFSNNLLTTKANENPLREKPNDNSKIITEDDMCFVMDMMQGDWIKVHCINELEGCCPNNQKTDGYLRWKKDNQILIQATIY
jgi:hypothetical protein